MAAPPVNPMSAIAVVGMAGRFPGAQNVNDFWTLLMNNGDAIRPVPLTRWDGAELAGGEMPVPNAGGFLTDIDLFDPTFFGISPREAVEMDPQHRLMLETTWEALEDAGQRAIDLRGSRTGVYVGASWHDYDILRKERKRPTTQHSLVGNVLDAAAARVSYFLGITGPSMAIETGCSSSLVALDLAIQALRSGDVPSALVGGVSLMLSPDTTLGLTHFGGLSPTGRCHAFGAGADGFVRGEGVIAFFLKRLDRALEDGNHVRALILESSVNNDGGGESLVTPNPFAQESLLRLAYDQAFVSPDNVAYVEAHGTGTRRGDPVEAAALGSVLGRGRTVGPLPIGSVKTNIGHLEPAAGLAGLVKSVLALEHGIVPSSQHSEELNPEIDFDNLNLKVVHEPLLLPRGAVIGVNSFGWGGTNAHVIVASADGLMDVTSTAPAAPAAPAANCRNPALIAISAHRSEELTSRALQLVELLDRPNSPSVHELADALAWKRDHFPARIGLVVEDRDDAASQLAALQPTGASAGRYALKGTAAPCHGVAFAFSGQGAQWAGMGAELFAHEPVFADSIRACATALAPHITWDLLETVTGPSASWLERVDIVQPASWAVAVALAELWRSYGVEPDMVIGHSQGEIAAATVSGALCIEDAALVIAARSTLVARASGQGGMLAVDLSIKDAEHAIQYHGIDVSLAAENGPRSCIISGDRELLRVLQHSLEGRGVYCRPVKVDYAAHSPAMEDLARELSHSLAAVRPRVGGVPFVSSVVARRLDGHELDAAYWQANLRRPVKFATAIGVVLKAGMTHVIEVSPHPVLASAMREILDDHKSHGRVLTTLHRGYGSPRDFASARAAAYVSGLSPFPRSRRGVRVELPGYPWQRSSFWPTPGRVTSQSSPLAFTFLPDQMESGTARASVRITPEDQPWLLQHRVSGTPVLPGAASLILAIEAARTNSRAGSFTLHDLQLHSAIAVGEAPVLLGGELREETFGSSFTLRHLPDGTSSWNTCAKTQIHYDATNSSAGPTFPTQLLSAPEVDVNAEYTRAAARGLEYGPSFRAMHTVRAVRHNGSLMRVLADVRIAGPQLTPASSGGIHPTLLDGALQTCLVLCEGNETQVPIKFSRVKVFSDLSQKVNRLWAHAERRADGFFNVDVFDVAQRPVLSVEGLVLHPIESVASELESDHAYRVAWKEAPSGPGDGKPLMWTLAGAQVVDGLEKVSMPIGLKMTLHKSSAADDVTSVRYAAENILFMVPDNDLAVQRSALWELTRLVQAGTASGRLRRLVVVTHDAQAVMPGDTPDPGAALFWGFMRVLRREHPALRPLLLDVASSSIPWQDVVKELLVEDGEEEVAFRGEHRYVARLTRGLSTNSESVSWSGPAQPFHLVSQRPGSYSGLRWLPHTRTAPLPGCIELEVHAAGINFLDALKALGAYPDPFAVDRLGNECAGRVVRLGPGVDRVAVGDLVVAAASGAMASHVIVRADHVQRIPESMPIDEAAALPVALLTAWYALNDLARLQTDETVLVHSAAGGLGLAAVAVARRLGARVMTTAGTPDKRRYLQSLGIKHVFNSRDSSWSSAVQEVTGGRGVDVVLNSLSGVAVELGLEALAEDGRFIEVGKKDIYDGRHLPLSVFRNRLGFFSVDLCGLQRQKPEVFAKLFADAWRELLSGYLTTLPTTPFAFVEVDQALRAMSSPTHHGKLVLIRPDSITSVTPDPTLHSEATYVITGGLGALGLSFAEYLVTQGARYLVLIGRSIPTPEADERLQVMRLNGATVDILICDVANSDALEIAFKRIRQRRPAIRGVVHAAGLLDDATVSNLELGSLDRILAPKVDGTLNLDRATRTDPLDFFLLFSSIATLVGNPGQAAYAAGNAFMDAVALARRSAGLPATSIQWGPFLEIGLAAAQENRGGRLAARGMSGLAVNQAWAVAQYLLQEGKEAVIAYAPINLRRWFDSNPDVASSATWSELRSITNSGGEVANDAEELVDWSSLRDYSCRKQVMEQRVREVVAIVLGMDVAMVEPDAAFKALGLDSLMSLELRNRLEKVFGLRLSPTLLWAHGNSRALAAELANRFSEPLSPGMA